MRIPAFTIETASGEVYDPTTFSGGTVGDITDVQFDRVGVQRYAFFENSQGFIVATFVVQVMGLFVEIVGAEECVRHRQDLRRQDGLRQTRRFSRVEQEKKSHQPRMKSDR